MFTGRYRLTKAQASNADLHSLQEDAGDRANEHSFAALCRRLWGGQRRLFFSIFLSVAVHTGLLLVGGEGLTLRGEAPVEKNSRIQAALGINRPVSPGGSGRKFANPPSSTQVAHTKPRFSGSRQATQVSKTLWVPETSEERIDHYYTSGELDELPQMIGELPESFTEFSELAVAGQLLLSLWIDASGTVLWVDVSGSTLPPIFGEVASQKFASAPFSPGKIDGQPVKSQINVVFRYEEILPELGQHTNPP